MVGSNGTMRAFRWWPIRICRALAGCLRVWAVALTLGVFVFPTQGSQFAEGSPSLLPVGNAAPLGQSRYAWGSIDLATDQGEAFGLLAAPIASTGNTYYVGPVNCSDSGPGTQINPSCTINR